MGSGTIDNYASRSHKRRSQDFELAAMEAMRAEVLRRFPSAGTKLRDLVIVPEVPLDREVTGHMLKLKDRDIVRRRRCQYGSMAQLTCDIATPVDVSIVEGDFLWKSLRVHLEHADNEWLISQRALEVHPELTIFQWLRFPLVGYSKEKILEEA